jgi:hypothetical protein
MDLAIALLGYERAGAEEGHVVLALDVHSALCGRFRAFFFRTGAGVSSWLSTHAARLSTSARVGL